MNRNTTTRDRHRQTIKQTKSPCQICGEPINYDLPHLDPMAYVVDHIIPLAHGGPDTLNNKQPTHRVCNRAKGHNPNGGPIIKKSGSLKKP